MATFGDIQSAVSKRLLDPANTSVSASDVAQAINAAISYWKFRRFWFNEVSDTATLTAQSPVFPYPSNFLVPATKDDGFYISYSSQRYPMTKISQPDYDAIIMANGFGLPRAYARIGDTQYQCYPIPDQNYTVGRHYLKQYADLSSSTDTNDFTIYADKLIESWALANLSAELRQDDKMEAYYRNKAKDEYKNLGVMSNKTNATGRLSIN